MHTLYLYPEMTIPNTQLHLADQYVRFTNKNVFLTGKAGTGKTTFLKSLKKTTPKRIVVVAPTGVAAINAGGVTIHSFFQLPFGPIVPDTSNAPNKFNEHKYSTEKLKTIRAMDLLVIDEISMVRADMLDGIDAVLRRYRNRLLPFGGVQVLMIGDLHQLAPIVKEEEWILLKPYYASVFFFDSRVLKTSAPVVIELTHIYRQADERFINLLNKIREKSLNQYDIELINTRYIPDFEASADEEYITLTTHNYTAQSINQNRLMEIPGKIYTYMATVENEFPESSYPNEFRLELKIGAQIMFVKNDTSVNKLFFNGKLGVISDIRDSQIYIRCQDDKVDIAVGQVTWQNIKYALDENKQLQENIIGSFTQYPIKLAWAITIHKSQGLTFERAIIDAQSSFAHGQVYVALSRCKTFEGMVLRTPISPQSIRMDQTISTYNSEAQQQNPNEASLLEARKSTQCVLIKELFDFKAINRSLAQLHKQIGEHHKSLIDSTWVNIQQLISFFHKEILEIGDRFLVQLEIYFNQTDLPEEDAALQDRIKKGNNYLTSKIEGYFLDTLSSLDLDADNKEIRKSLVLAQEFVLKDCFEKTQVLKACANKFETHAYIQAKANASIDFNLKKPVKKLVLKDDVQFVNGELYRILKNWRNQLAETRHLPEYMILSVQSIKLICHDLPGNLAALEGIKGMGKTKIEKFGTQLLEIINDYCLKNNLKVNMQEDSPANPVLKKVKGETRKLTYSLFESGKSIAEIAKERDMATSTIESHLAEAIALGIIQIDKVMPIEKIEKLKTCILDHPEYTARDLKDHFGDEMSYGEIRMVRASLNDNGF